MVYPALLQLMRTPRLPVVDWTDDPADLNGLVRFAQRRNLVSARMPTHFNWPLLPSITLKVTHFVDTFTDSESWDISLVYCTGCWLHDWRIGLLHLIRTKYYSLFQIVETGSRTNSVSYSVGTLGCSPVVKWPGSESCYSPPSSIEVKNKGSHVSTLPLFMQHSQGRIYREANEA